MFPNTGNIKVYNSALWHLDYFLFYIVHSNMLTWKYFILIFIALYIFLFLTVWLHGAVIYTLHIQY